jgi:hypothetical protein
MTAARPFLPFSFESEKAVKDSEPVTHKKQKIGHAPLLELQQEMVGCLFHSPAKL